MTSLWLACLLAGLSMTSALAAPKFIVNCGNPTGGTISEALASEKPTIVVKGTCTESPTIMRDDVTLEAHDTGGTILGTVTISGAQRATIQGLTITSSDDGLVVTNGASATILNNQIVNNGLNGVVVTNGSFARLVDNAIIGNGQSNPDTSGLVVLRAVAFGQHNGFSNNAFAGIELLERGIYRSDRDTTSGNGAFSVAASRGGYAELRGVTAIGNITLDHQSQFQSRNLTDAPSTITGNISARTLSYVRLRSGVTLNGAFVCDAATFSICQFN